MSGSVHIERPFEVAIVAGSQGAISAWGPFFGALPAALGVPVLLIQHRLRGPSFIGDVVRRRSALRVDVPATGRRLRSDTIYICPSDRQLRLNAAGIPVLSLLGSDERAQADPVLCSAAAAFGPRVLAVVLSGRLQDAAKGAQAVKRAGGRVLVQDPASAECPSMPAATLATGYADLCLPPRSLAHATAAFVGVPGAAELFSAPPSPWAHAVMRQDGVGPAL